MNNFWSLIVGAILAISGGAFVEWIRLKLERNQEVNFIKISLIDELEEMESIIEKLSEVWEKTGVVHIAYVNDLSNNMNAYEQHQSRLFLFSDADLRKSITGFYRKLKKLIQESEEKVGSLADNPEAKTEQEKIKSNFISLCQEAKNIKIKL